MLADYGIEVRFLREQVEIVHEMGKVLSIIGSRRSWFWLWRSTNVRWNSFCVVTTQTILVRWFARLINCYRFWLFVYWKRTIVRLSDIILRAFLSGLYRLIINSTLSAISCLLYCTYRATISYSRSHHMLLICVALKLLLHIRNVERCWVNHTLRHILVWLDIASV